jgi:hypothetical protein
MQSVSDNQLGFYVGAIFCKSSTDSIDAIMDSFNESQDLLLPLRGWTLLLGSTAGSAGHLAGTTRS